MNLPRQTSNVTAFVAKPQVFRNNITLIASGKGGVGKTWFTVSMSHILSLVYHRKVMIFDGDLGLANVDIQLGLMPEQDLGSFLEGRTSFSDAIVTYKNGGFDILAGRSGTGSLSSLSYTQLALIREELKESAAIYDHLFVDLGAGVGGSVRSLAPVARTCLLIINDEPTALTDGYAFMKVIHKQHPHMLFKIIVNYADSLVSGDKTFRSFADACQRFLGYQPELAGVIRRDARVRQSIRHQSSLVREHPNTPAVRDLKRVAARLLTSKEPTAKIAAFKRRGS